MKKLITLFSLLFVATLQAELKEIKAGLYRWNDLEVVDQGTSERRNFMEGHTLDLAYLEIHATTLLPGYKSHAPHSHSGDEEMLIVNEGKLAVTINDESTILGPNSIAVFMPGDSHGVANAGEGNVTYYVFRYKTKTPQDDVRAKTAGGSFISNWDELEFGKSDIGGRRQNFDRGTSMFKRFEFHTSTLFKSLQNHNAHTHRAEEMVIVLQGKVEMLIGDEYMIAEVGDIYFIQADILHSLKNIGDETTEYFAFQWQ